MSFAALCRDILKQAGFEPIGEIRYRLHVTAWWNPSPEKRVQVLVMDLGNAVLVKGDKAYCLQSVTSEGETWARDIPSLHDYLETHLPEVRISFSHFRDVPATQAKAEVDRHLTLESPTRPRPSTAHVAEVQKRLQAKQQAIHSAEGLLSLSAFSSDLLTGYVHQQGRSQQREIKELDQELKQQQERLSVLQHLQREYQHKGSAAVYTFSISSNLQVVEHPARFRDALNAVVKELKDQDRYQVQQKLRGGRLNIQAVEAEEPVMTWIEQWFGGGLSPMQLERLGVVGAPVRSAAMKHTMVTPDEPIMVDGHVRYAEKHVAARFVSSLMSRLDKSDARGQRGALDVANVPPEAMPLCLGLLMTAEGQTSGAAALPLTKMLHAAVSGTTGSGKSFLSRVIVEEAAKYKELSILVLDPRAQFSGLLVPEDRPAILRQYEEFGMNPGEARGFAFNYYAPMLPFVPPLPEEVGSLTGGRSVVSLKGMDDQQRCALSGRILDAVFKEISARESERPRLLILVDEAHSLTRKRVDESARGAAAQVERSLDRIVREGRKYGLCLVIVSQSIKDFSHDLVTIRQMASTKIFLRNSDRELQYAKDIIGDGRALVHLQTGVALLHAADLGLHRIRVRPPYSKVYELSEPEIRRLFAVGGHQAPALSLDAQKLFSTIESRLRDDRSPLNLSQAAELAGISSRRRLMALVSELESAGALLTRHLPERGRPRVIEIAKGLASSTVFATNGTRRSDGM